MKNLQDDPIEEVVEQENEIVGDRPTDREKKA